MGGAYSGRRCNAGAQASACITLRKLVRSQGETRSAGFALLRKRGLQALVWVGTSARTLVQRWCAGFSLPREDGCVLHSRQHGPVAPATWPAWSSARWGTSRLSDLFGHEAAHSRRETDHVPAGRVANGINGFRRTGTGLGWECGAALERRPPGLHQRMLVLAKPERPAGRFAGGDCGAPSGGRARQLDAHDAIRQSPEQAGRPAVRACTTAPIELGYPGAIRTR